MKEIIAVDIGGTQLRAALYSDQELKPVKLARMSTQKTPKESGPQEPVERLAQLIESIIPPDNKVDVISVAAPGPVNPYTGVLLEAPNIPGWWDVPLASILEERFQVKTLLGNDANLAALGEWMYGAGRGHKHMIYLTVSTGIGGGIIVDDRLLLGARGLAAEVGHVTVLPEGPVCGCGQRGHLEALASGTAIARWVTEQLARGAESQLSPKQLVTAKMVSTAAQAGDSLCISALAQAGYYLGIAIASLLQTFNATAVIMGGGVARSGALLFEPLMVSLKQHIMNSHYLDDLVITPAAFGDEAGLTGALALGRNYLNQIANSD
jgi:glucokinase